MAYTPKDWVTGEVITESALDHIEQGIASVVLTVTIDPDTDAFDKTWQEVHDAFVGGSVVTVLDEVAHGHSMSFVTQVTSSAGAYSVDVGGTTYMTNSADGHPGDSVG